MGLALVQALKIDRKYSGWDGAFFLEAHGMEWKGMRESVFDLESLLGIDYDPKAGRTDRFIAAQKKIASLGFIRPPNYLPPWERGGRSPKLTNTKIKNSTLKDFYKTWEWKTARYAFMQSSKRACSCCGGTPDSGKILNVDHIKPIRKYWHLRLDQTNLQMLCSSCNMGKGSHDETDWRGREP
jgi:hypothetical protein